MVKYFHFNVVFSGCKQMARFVVTKTTCLTTVIYVVSIVYCLKFKNILVPITLLQYFSSLIDRKRLNKRKEAHNYTTNKKTNDEYSSDNSKLFKITLTQICTNDIDTYYSLYFFSYLHVTVIFHTIFSLKTTFLISIW